MLLFNTNLLLDDPAAFALIMAAVAVAPTTSTRAEPTTSWSHHDINRSVP